MRTPVSTGSNQTTARPHGSWIEPSLAVASVVFPLITIVCVAVGIELYGPKVGCKANSCVILFFGVFLALAEWVVLALTGTILSLVRGSIWYFFHFMVFVVVVLGILRFNGII